MTDQARERERQDVVRERDNMAEVFFKVASNFTAEQVALVLEEDVATILRWDREGLPERLSKRKQRELRVLSAQVRRV